MEMKLFPSCAPRIFSQICANERAKTPRQSPSRLIQARVQATLTYSKLFNIVNG